MKKVLLTILALFCFIPLVSAKKEPVKVYIFEAGGCPYCEAEIEYLKGLSSYNKKFVIVQKEAYVDHVDWAQGKDFELAQKVADAFKAAGFQDATYQATPFVVISDLYAAAAYSTELESVIEEAYEKLTEIAQEGGKVVFVGTKKQASEACKECAERTNMYYYYCFNFFLYLCYFDSMLLINL